MNEKTTVTIAMPSGQTKTYSGDTVILFTLNGIEECLRGETNGINSTIGYVGMTIPEPFFAKTMAEFIGTIVKNAFEESPMEEAYNIDAICNILEKHNEKINNALREKMGTEEFKKLVMEFLMKM